MQGRLSPADNYNCTLTVTLYKRTVMVGTSYNPGPIELRMVLLPMSMKQKKVNRGVYKVVSVGNVDGEKVRVESAENILMYLTGVMI